MTTDERQAPLADSLADNLALALIASSMAPLLLLDSKLNVIAASASFTRAFKIDEAGLQGSALLSLGAGEWNLPQLASLLRATASGIANIEAYEMDLKRPGKDNRRLVLNAQKLHYGASGAIRILLTVSDVTDARIAERLKDDLLRDKAVLLQELQHRVANSLQIIASVLLQSARRVQSDETRCHLHAAHTRVMSVAALQKQLAASSVDDVVLRSYFIDLCQSIGASMIRDHNQISLEVSADDSVASADISVSLGLIVTELVINALKHAFPDDRNGRILVDYASAGASGWTLSVGDNGVGMPRALDSSKQGLGTSIVQSLARQLDAKVSVTDEHPGTLISVTHTAGVAFGSSKPVPQTEPAA